MVEAEMRMRFVMLVISLIAALMLNCGTAKAQSDVKSAKAQPDAKSADFLMRGCRNTAKYLSQTYLGGVCDGSVGVLMSLGREFLGFCPPAEATRNQGVFVVVQYIDGHPARLHENFEALATAGGLAV
jgi:Rap1a immunity proteins